MEELGWTNVFIEHNIQANQEEINNIEIKAKIYSDFTTELINPILTYSINNGKQVSIDLIPNKTDSLFSATIMDNENSTVSYFISVKDKYDRTFYYPNSAPTLPVQIIIGPDNIKPEVSYIPNRYFFISEKQLPVFCDVKDAFGIDTVYLEYRMNEANIKTLGLKHYSENTYHVIVDFSLLNLQIGDSIQFRIVAKDASVENNSSINPENGFHKLKVIDAPEFIEVFETDFEKGSNEFILDGFNFSKEEGFNNISLNSLHPYRTSSSYKPTNFTAEFKYPIIIDETYHYISFDEIAMIESGEPNSSFGDEEFYDYVIIEGTKDDGETWIPFEDGWDCRFNENWVDNYYMALYEAQYFKTSRSIAQKELFARHQVNLIQPNEFSVGDIIRIRFRLNSDSYDVGWGWAIDNLQIQTIGLNKKDFKNTKIAVYPNPINENHFSIKGITEKIERIRIYDYSGRLVFQQNEGIMLEKIDIPSQLKGFHILLIEGVSNSYKTKVLVL